MKQMGKEFAITLDAQGNYSFLPFYVKGRYSTEPGRLLLSVTDRNPFLYDAQFESKMPNSIKEFKVQFEVHRDGHELRWPSKRSPQYYMAFVRKT